MYSEGDGVEEDTTKQKIYHLEQAAIAGHPEARYNLGMHERRKLSMERAMKHFIIAASNGHDLSMKKMVRKGYETGLVTKKDLPLLFAHIRQPGCNKKSTEGCRAAEV